MKNRKEAHDISKTMHSRELEQAKTNVPGIIHRWQGRVHTRKMLDMGIAQDGRNEEVTSVAF